MAHQQHWSILITGANRGLGLEMVKQLLEKSCTKQRKIFAACRNPDGAQDLQVLAKKHPDVITVVRLDATDPVSIKQSAVTVGSKLGNKGLNVLVNNAGVMTRGKLNETTTDNMHETFNTNVIGPMAVTKEYLPLLRLATKAYGKPGMSCEKAAVINISSALGSMTCIPQLYSLCHAFSYNISKAGLNMLTVCIALELKPEEILCTALHPGWVRTDLGGQQAPMEVKESIEGLLKVMGTLKEEHHGGFLDYAGKPVPF